MQWWCPPSSMGVRLDYAEETREQVTGMLKDVSTKSGRCDKAGQSENEDVRRSLGQEAIMDIVKKKQRRWKVRMEKMNGEQLVKQVYEGEVIGRRPKGRPGKQWSDNLK